MTKALFFFELDVGGGGEDGWKGDGLRLGDAGEVGGGGEVGVDGLLCFGEGGGEVLRLGEGGGDELRLGESGGECGLFDNDFFISSRGCVIGLNVSDNCLWSSACPRCNRVYFLRMLFLASTMLLVTSILTD